MPVTIASLNTDDVTSTEFMTVGNARDGRGRFRTISRTEFGLMDGMFETSPDCRAAYEAICAGLLSGPIMLSGMEVDERLERQLQSEYRILCANAIRDLLRYGFVVVSINRATMLPYTISPMLLLVQHRAVIGGPSEYRVFRAPGGTVGSNFMGALDRRPLDDVMVFERCAPDATGHLTSPMAALLNMEAFRNAMMRAAAVAFKRMARPGVYTTEKDATVSQEILQRDFTHLGESTTLATHTIDVNEQLRADRERAQSMYRVEQNAAAADLAGAGAARGALLLGGGGGAGDLGNDPFGGGASLLDPLLRMPAYGDDATAYERPPEEKLPPNREVTPWPQAHAPIGMAEADKAVESNVAKVFGVPSAIFSGAHDNSVATNQTALTGFYSTLQSTRIDMQMILEVVLMYTQGDVHISQLRRYVENGGRELVWVRHTDGAEDSKRAKKRRRKEEAEEDPASASAGAGTDPDKHATGTAAVGDTSASGAGAASAAAAAGADSAKNTPTTTKKRAGGEGDGGDAEEEEVARGEAAVIVQRYRPMFAPARRLTVTFPALLDATIIESLRAIGAISWGTTVDMLSAFYGVDRRLLSDVQLEPATQMPLAAETMRARRVEQTAMNRGLVELAAATTSSETLRASVANGTLGGTSFTGATAVPAIGKAKKKKKKKKTAKKAKAKGGKDDKEEKPKPARAAIKTTTKAPPGGGLTKGVVRTDRSKNPTTNQPTLRSAV